MMDIGERIVFAGFRKKDNLPVVIIIAKDLYPRARGSLPREVAMLLRVRGHPNVAEILGWRVLSDNTYALLMRHYIECDPRTAIRGNLCCIARYIFQVVSGISHLHARQVAHRDICLDNILYNAVDERVVVNDMDLACPFRSQGFFKDVGRELYYPPEKRATVDQRRFIKKELREELKRSKLNVVTSKPSAKIQRYDQRADIFSAGMMLYVLLNRLDEPPDSHKVKKWLKKVKDRKLAKKHVELDLVLGMLDPDPRKRFSIEQIIEHEFFRGGDNVASYQALRHALLETLETEPRTFLKQGSNVVIEDCSESENSNREDTEDDRNDCSGMMGVKEYKRENCNEKQVQSGICAQKEAKSSIPNKQACKSSYCDETETNSDRVTEASENVDFPELEPRTKSLCRISPDHDIAHANSAKRNQRVSTLETAKKDPCKVNHDFKATDSLSRQEEQIPASEDLVITTSSNIAEILVTEEAAANKMQSSTNLNLIGEAKPLFCKTERRKPIVSRRMRKKREFE
jgi:serine/threonine protein kinase